MGERLDISFVGTVHDDLYFKFPIKILECRSRLTNQHTQQLFLHFWRCPLSTQDITKVNIIFSLSRPVIGLPTPPLRSILCMTPFKISCEVTGALGLAMPFSVPTWNCFQMLTQSIQLALSLGVANVKSHECSHSHCEWTCYSWILKLITLIVPATLSRPQLSIGYYVWSCGLCSCHSFYFNERVGG